MDENLQLLQELTDQIKPCDTDNPYVFISYSSLDSEKVFRDVIEFQKRGYNVWIDVKNVDKTQPSWKTSAIAAVSDYSCSLLVFYVSENSLTSKNCYEEVIATLNDTTYENHYGYINILCIDVCEIHDITKLAEEIKLNIKKSDLDKPVKQERTKYLTRFMTGIFNNNNERSRALSADHPGRSVKYYEEILQSFPEETQNAPLGSANGERDSGGSAAAQAAVNTAADQASVSSAQAHPSGVQKITFKSGNIYEGELKDGKSHGKGKITFTNGNYYDGDWVDSHYCGHGTFKFADGSYYIGEFKNDTYDGQGEFHYPSGNVYQGEFKNGKRNGKGKMTYKSGAVYEGDWADEKYNGMGTYTFADGRYYTGSFSDNTYNGFGEFHYSNGDVYRGSYRGGKRDGKGIITYGGGNALYTDGEFVSGNLIRGKTVFRNGCVYEGSFKEGKRGGDGIFTYANGNVYKGEFLDDKFHGRGTYTFKDGQYYTGEFRDNTYNGQGEYHYSNGSVYVGGFKNGKKDGLGTLTYKDGKKVSGKWENGKLIEETNEIDVALDQIVKDSKSVDLHAIPANNTNDGYQIHTLEDRSLIKGNYINGKLEGAGSYEAFRNGKDAGVYTGTFKHGAYDGWGTFVFPDGRKYVGGFMNNLAHGHGTYTVPKGSFVGDKYYATDFVYEGDFIEGKFGGETLEIPHP